MGYIWRDQRTAPTDQWSVLLCYSPSIHLLLSAHYEEAWGGSVLHQHPQRWHPVQCSLLVIMAHKNSVTLTPAIDQVATARLSPWRISFWQPGSRFTSGLAVLSFCIRGDDSIFTPVWNHLDSLLFRPPSLPWSRALRDLLGLQCISIMQSNDRSAPL